MRYLKAAIKILAGLVLVLMAAVSGLLCLLWFDHTRATSLPTPSGPFAVGRTTMVWKDTRVLDGMAPQPGTRRELFVWIWYPSDKQPTSATVDDYLPAAWRKAIDDELSPVLRLFVTRDLSKVHAHAYQDVSVSSAQTPYPVVLLRAGAAAQITQYTSLAEDLASHGYVVVGFDAPYRTFTTVFPDGRVISRAAQNNVELASGAEQRKLATQLTRAWSSDMSYALDQLEKLNASDATGRFTGRLDLRKVGALGHSLGGATALQFCHDDSRCKAGIDLDGLPLGDMAQEGVTQPFLFLLSDHGKEPDAVRRPVLADIRAIFDRLPANKRVWISIRGAGHFLFADDAMLQLPLVRSVLHQLGVMPLAGRRQVEITEHYISAFFDVYLKTTASAVSLQQNSRYPEVDFMN